MAGGTWIAQNKVRPGAYINFESVEAPISNVGTRGILTMPVAMDWGEIGKMIPLYSTDLINGKSLAKIGTTAFEKSSLIFREALSTAYLAQVYRIDTGGTKAVAAIGDLAVSAKYAGVFGNKISVAIESNTPNFDIITYVSSNEKDRQTVPINGEGLVGNEWVNFSLAEDESLVTEVGLFLAEGTNGTVKTENYADYFLAAGFAIWNTMAIPTKEELVKMQAVNFIKNKRDNTGRKCQVVLFDKNKADFEGVISVDQGYINAAGERIEPEMFTITFAGMTAGAALNKSNTGAAVSNAKEIINPIADEDVEVALKAGKLLLTYSQKGEVTIEQDINSLHSFTPSKSYSFSKNRVIRTLDEIGNQILIKFEGSYKGKVDNDNLGHNVFKADIISYMNELQSMRAIKNFDPQTDITVGPGMGIDAVVAALWIQPVDSMEKLYMMVYVGGVLVKQSCNRKTDLN